MFSAEQLESRRTALEEELGEPITVDGLTATLRIFQRKKGHRHSTDDLLTAWYALVKSPPVTRCLDLGTGIGTVGLDAAQARLQLGKDRIGNRCLVASCACGINSRSNGRNPCNTPN